MKKASEIENKLKKADMTSTFEEFDIDIIN
jgi:hypothetical protein